MVGHRIERAELGLGGVTINQWAARVIVLTQACDLAQGIIDKALVAPVFEAQKLVDAGVLKLASVRDQVRRHLVFGWYFLPAALPPFDLAESLIDLRDVHSVPIAILNQLVVAGKRIATLTSPYREHLAQHFAVTYMRVALPDQYQTLP